MTLEQILAARVAAVDASKAIIAKADAEKRDLTDAEADQVERLTGEASSHAAEAAKIERRTNARAAAAQADADLARPQGRKVVDAARDLPAGAPAVAREAFLDDPMFGFKSHRHFFSAVQADVQRRGAGRQDPRLSALRAPVLATAGSDEQGTYSDAYGNFLVPKTMAPGVISIGYDADPLAGLTTKIPMVTPEVSLNARVDKDHTTSVSGGLVTYRRAETQLVSATRMSFEQIVMHADTLMGVGYATEEVLRDSPESFAAILDKGFRDEFSARAMIERLGGTGVGQPLGVNNAAGKIDVAKEGGQGGATINYTNLIKMRARCWGYGNAVWYANSDTIPQLFAVTAPGSTIPLVTQDATGMERLFGRPIYFGEFAETLGTVGDILLLNLGEYYEGEYQPIEAASSMHVRFLEHEQCFKFWKRNAGSPAWRTVLTPRKGATLAPIVRLATRA